MNMPGYRNNKLWSKRELTFGWQKQDFLCIYFQINSLTQAPSSRSERGQTCTSCGKTQWRNPKRRHCWTKGDGRERRKPDALGRLSRLLQVIVTHPHLSAGAHCTSVSPDLKMINLNLHPYINTLAIFSPAFPKLPLGDCASYSGDSSNYFCSVI